MPESTPCPYCTLPLTMYPHYVKCYTCMWQATPRELVAHIKKLLNENRYYEKTIKELTDGV